MKRKGFTLIELLVVISTISIMSSIILASLTQARMKGRDGLRVSQINEVEKALALYYTTHGVYPDNKPNTLSSLNSEVPENWNGLMTDLASENLIQSTAISYNKNNTNYSFIKKVFAVVDWPYFGETIQDPLYKTGENFKYSYAYVAALDRKSYIIRVYLENSPASYFNGGSPYTGKFISNFSNGDTACDFAYKYSCRKSVL